MLMDVLLTFFLEEGLEEDEEGGNLSGNDIDKNMLLLLLLLLFFFFLVLDFCFLDDGDDFCIIMRIYKKTILIRDL